MKNGVFASWLYRRTFKKFLKQIRERVNDAEELWGIDQEMDMLWRLGAALIHVQNKHTSSMVRVCKRQNPCRPGLRFYINEESSNPFSPIYKGANFTAGAQQGSVQQDFKLR